MIYRKFLIVMTLIFFVVGLSQFAQSKESSARKKREEKSVVMFNPASSSSEAIALVKEMRYWSTPDYTRVAVTLDREVKFKSNHLLANRATGTPSRLYIDLSDSRMTPGLKDIPIGDGLLKMARIAQYQPDVVRVVLDLDSVKDYKIFTFSDPFRIIIDVKGDQRTEISRSPEPTIAPLPPSVMVPAKKQQQTKERTEPPVSPIIAKIRRIVVDPGHGGRDPGAIGASGVLEKDIVLRIGLKLARELKKSLGLDVVMTRSTDVFLELQERTALANQVGADLFVSVHANASLNHKASGIETYYLNLAKTEKAAELAAKENGTTLEKVSILQAVLFDMMANYKLNDSASLAEAVQLALYHKISSRNAVVRNLGVKQGPFYVLVGASMPSILVEVAFLSNKREERLLQNSKYQDEIATGIMQGIKRYIESVN